MPNLTRDFGDWHRITFARAHVLRELADGRTLTEASAVLAVSPNGIRSTVRDLKLITGCCSARELGRWWREHRHAWVERCAAVAGVCAVA